MDSSEERVSSSGLAWEDKKSSLAGCDSGLAGQACDGLAVAGVGKHSAMDCHAAISVQACRLACEYATIPCRDKELSSWHVSVHASPCPTRSGMCPWWQCDHIVRAPPVSCHDASWLQVHTHVSGHMLCILFVLLGEVRARQACPGATV